MRPQRLALLVANMYQPNEHLRNPPAAIALTLWSCPAHAFCEPTEEEIAAARDRIEAREASGMVGMGYDVAMVMDADNIRKRRAAVRFRLRLSQFPRSRG